MLDTPGEVIAALSRYRAVFDPRTGSLLAPRKGGSAGADPFHPAFLAHLEERDVLVRRLRRLRPRERRLLYLWYALGWPATKVAEAVGVSRVHCYRLARKALYQMTRPTPDEQPQGRAG